MDTMGTVLALFHVTMVTVFVSTFIIIPPVLAVMLPIAITT